MGTLGGLSKAEARIAELESALAQQTALVCRWDERDHEQAVRIAELEQLLRAWARATRAESAVWNSEGDDWAERMGKVALIRQQAEEELLAAAEATDVSM